MKRAKLLLCLSVMLIGILCSSSALAANWKNMPYWIGVEVKSQRVTVYKTEDNSVVYKWACSTGRATPLGTFIMPSSTSGSLRAAKFIHGGGGTYFTWASCIKGAILFHTYLFSSKDFNAVMLDTVKALGTPASHGCVRLPLDAAKWIAKNCLPGTRVIIYTNYKDPRITSVIGRVKNVPDKDFEDAPSSVSIINSKGEKSVDIGSKLKLKAILTPENAKTTVTWITSNAKVATVNQKGVVTGKKAGTVTISAVTSNAHYASYKIKVYDPAVARKVQLSVTGSVSLQPGETLEVTASVVPETATTKLKWKTSDASVVTVNGNGTVTAVNPGEATVTCTTSNKKSASFTVTVSEQ